MESQTEAQPSGCPLTLRSPTCAERGREKHSLGVMHRRAPCGLHQRHCRRGLRHCLSCWKEKECKQYALSVFKCTWPRVEDIDANDVISNAVCTVFALIMLPVMLFAQVYGINTYLTSVATVCVRKQLTVQWPACCHYLCARKQSNTVVYIGFIKVYKHIEEHSLPKYSVSKLLRLRGMHPFALYLYISE